MRFIDNHGFRFIDAAEPEVVGASGSPVAIAIQRGSRRIAEHFVATQVGTQVQPQLVFPFGGPAVAGFFMFWERTAVPRGSDLYIVRAGSHGQFDVRIFAVVVIITSDDLTLGTDDGTGPVECLCFLKDSDQRVQQAGVGLAFGKRFHNQGAGLFLLLCRVAQIDREFVEVDVVAVGFMEVLRMHHIVIARRQVFRWWRTLNRKGIGSERHGGGRRQIRCAFQTKYKTHGGHQGVVIGFSEIAFPLSASVQYDHRVLEVGIDPRNESQVLGCFLDIVDHIGCERIEGGRIGRREGHTLVGRFQELQAQPVTPHGDRFANTLFLFIGNQVENRVAGSRLADGTLKVVIDLLNANGTVGTKVGIDVLSPVVVNFVRDVTVARFIGATWKIKQTGRG